MPLEDCAFFCPWDCCGSSSRLLSVLLLLLLLLLTHRRLSPRSHIAQSGSQS
jgi:hypothetical protein